MNIKRMKEHNIDPVNIAQSKRCTRYLKGLVRAAVLDGIAHGKIKRSEAQMRSIREATRKCITEGLIRPSS